MLLITGASKGIGKYLCEQYAARGEKIYGIYNSTEVSDIHPNITYVKYDITDFQVLREWIQVFTQNASQITLINCSGINYNSYAHKADIDLWKHVIDINLIGTFNLISAILPKMRAEGYGRIINFGSVLAELPSAGVSAYAASKSALFGMSKSIAVENATKGITINTINLGYSELGMISDVPDNYLQEMLKRIPVNKLCKASDIFNTVEYLRNTEYITGTEININGGLL